MPFDFHQPDYVAVFKERAERLKKIRSGSIDLKKLRLYYKDHIADFIEDWGVTFDPRNVGDPMRPAYLPFVLFTRQREWIEWFVARMIANQDGVCEKSRDMGVSWLAVSVAASLCLFNDWFSVGFGSRKEEYVDKLDDPKCLFWKARQFIQNLPIEFTGKWSLDKNAPHLRITFPDTNSFMTGESGDNIGRGDRARVYVVDEAAYLERPKLIDAALSQTTRCRIDVSSANGTANPFFEKRTKYVGTPQLFTFHWRDDPRKDEAWYENECNRLDPVVIAQEVDIDYTASVEGILIPNAWVQAAVDSHIKLGFEAEGSARAALDVADEGIDKNAFIGGKGSVVRHARQWSGKGIDIYQTVANGMAFCDDFGYGYVTYDADGVGSSVRGDSRKINEERERKVTFEPYRGSAGVLHPEREDEYGRLNKDFFANRKAQAWWRTRKRFERTWQAVTKGIKFNPDQLISLDKASLGELLPIITQQLSQPTFTRNEAGKIVVDKIADGAKSPDLGDAVVIWSENVGDAGEVFFEAGDMLIDAKPIEVPAHLETVFAVVHSAGRPGKDNSGTAVTFWAMQLEGPVIVLDWDYTEVEGDLLDSWIPRKFDQLNEYGERARLGSMGMFLSNEGHNPIILERALGYGDASVIEGRVADMDARGQALNASSHIKNVKLSKEAVGRNVTFRGNEKNHLLYQVRKFTADSKDVEDMAVLRSFVYGVNIAMEENN